MRGNEELKLSLQQEKSYVHIDVMDLLVERYKEEMFNANALGETAVCDPPHFKAFHK